MIFFISFLLIIWPSQRWASCFARSPADGFWIFIASVMLQVGALASLTSLVHKLNPAAWMLLQVLVCIATLQFTKSMGRPTLRGFLEAWGGQRARLAAFWMGLSQRGVITLVAICAILFVSLVMQAAAPIQNYDDRMYHASRVIYWIQHQTVFPFDTHNIRQTMIPFGSELFFLWPVLLTKAEAVGRLVFWLAFPLAAMGQYYLLRALKLSQTVALVGVLILISTPLVAFSATGLKPEIWSIVTLLGVAYWVVSICTQPDGSKLKYFFLGIFTVLSINVRSFPVSIIPSLLLILWWAPGPFSFTVRFKALAAGWVCAGVLSSLLIPLAFNTALYQHPLGPQEVRRVVQADITPQVIYTHAVRFVFLLLELPDVPASSETRSRISSAANQFIYSVGAGAPLAGENKGSWPGSFVYSLPEHSTRFSLWGLLWIPVLLIAAPLLIRNVVTTWPHVRLTAVSAQTLLAVPLLGAVLFGARWMAQSEVPGRFLIGPYALLLPIGIALVAPHLSTKKFAQALVAMVVAYSAYQPMRALAYDAVQAIAAPASEKLRSEPFEEITGSMMPTGSRILFVGNQDARDYSLFSPETGFSNAVIPWGTGPFDPERMGRLIAAEKVTHVLIQNDNQVFFEWFPTVDTREMVKWLTVQAGLKAIPLKTPRMRLFEVSGTALVNERPFQTAEAPPAAPLIRIDDALKTKVGIDPASLETPWPIENLGRREHGFLWMGQGHAEGIEFALWSREDRDVDIRFDVSPGHGLTAPDRRVMVLHGGIPVGGEHTFRGKASVVARTRLHAGRNTLSFFATDTATIKPLPNGDTRNLVIGLHEIRIEQAQVAAAGATRSTSPDRGGQDPSPTRHGELAHSALKAVGLISRRQQVEGYWLTSYTSEERFEKTKLEMNTYVTSMVVDVLGPKPGPAGLGGSLERARTHLRNQIEANGLVRYHGRPDGAAMTAHGLCPITPDSDDTALVWRLAPGADALRSPALAALMQYRTAEGLYKTWLGQRNEYRCIDPGVDPNPTDVAIQMHVLMWLAQADPPAAQSLCSALRHAIDQDRLWVYYRRAPLVPAMRQADMKAVGCDVQLPPSRLQTAVPGQEIWLNAGHMLQRLEEGTGKAPTSAEVLGLLQELSKNDFSLVKLNPPLLYHNDLTASVRRFYWSEDVGYAIWLRLYLESVRLGLLAANDSNNNSNAADGERTVQKTP
ncbi:glycosyltransferase family 39 protein [Acidovorax sp. Root275]|uniref:glycosyltransferase family 39 protein n=1 Tax=Acidovorax sp. Root275 TaxID=1736508 RepID=UPI001124DEE7|nr:glycosyltransferase family 39 protein [Acidovorax sp. Root275]